MILSAIGSLNENSLVCEYRVKRDTHIKKIHVDLEKLRYFSRIKINNKFIIFKTHNIHEKWPPFKQIMSGEPALP